MSKRSASSAPEQGWPWTPLCRARAPRAQDPALCPQGRPGSPPPSSLPAHLHAAVDGRDRRDPVVLVGTQQAAEAADELLVLLTEEAERVPVVRTDLGLRVPGELQGFDHLRQGDVRRGAAAVHLLPAHGAAQLRVRVTGQGQQAALAVGVAALQHQGLLEDLQTDGALQAVLQLGHAYLPRHPRSLLEPRAASLELAPSTPLAPSPQGP